MIQKCVSSKQGGKWVATWLFDRPFLEVVGCLSNAVLSWVSICLAQQWKHLVNFGNQLPLLQNKFACCPGSNTSNSLTPSIRLERNQHTLLLEIIYKLNYWIKRPHIPHKQPVFTCWRRTKQKLCKQLACNYVLFIDKYCRGGLMTLWLYKQVR